ncbi:MAG: MerR family transcriptional regulator [Bacteroidota bacterium]
MAIYSIKDLEKLCGIKAHTIRIWEQRYSIVKPKRTKTNIRYYQDADLKRLLNVALLNKNGFKISKIAKMSSEEMVEKVSAISEVNFEYNTQLDALTISMIEMDEYKFDRIISTNIQQIGFERTVLEIIYPFLDKLSVLWLTGSVNPIQENFMSYLIRQKIISAIDNEPFSSGKNVKKFMIFLPEGENQELSLLLMHYLLKSRRNQVVYLGQNVSIQDLKDACNIHQPDFIFTMITETYTKQPVQRYVDRLSENFPETEVLLSGYQIMAQNVASKGNVTALGSLDEVIHFLDILRNRSSLRNIIH